VSLRLEIDFLIQKTKDELLCDTTPRVQRTVYD